MLLGPWDLLQQLRDSVAIPQRSPDPEAAQAGECAVGPGAEARAGARTVCTQNVCAQNGQQLLWVLRVGQASNRHVLALAEFGTALAAPCTKPRLPPHPSDVEATVGLGGSSACAAVTLG